MQIQVSLMSFLQQESAFITLEFNSLLWKTLLGDSWEDLNWKWTKAWEIAWVRLNQSLMLLQTIVWCTVCYRNYDLKYFSEVPLADWKSLFYIIGMGMFLGQWSAAQLLGKLISLQKMNIHSTSTYLWYKICFASFCTSLFNTVWQSTYIVWYGNGNAMITNFNQLSLL